MTYHLQRPDSPNPNLQLPLHAIHVLELDPFPPAPPGRFTPEEEEFLCHADGVAVGEIVAFDVCAQPGEGETADDGLVGFAGAVAPSVVVVEAAGDS